MGGALRDGGRPGSHRPRLVELVGPAGAGKSSVFGALLARSEAVEGRPSLRKLAYAPVLAAEIASALATLLRCRALGPAVTPEQVRMMMYLQALPRILARAEARGRPRIIVFDQGPVYLLSRPSLRNERLTTWRDRAIATWSSLLDLVVCLDAPDPLLAERINARDKWHALKGVHGDTALEVLTASRAVYQDAVSRLDAEGTGLRILRFDTSRRSAVEIGDEVLAVLAAAEGRDEDPRRAAESSRR